MNNFIVGIKPSIMPKTTTMVIENKITEPDREAIKEVDILKEDMRRGRKNENFVYKVTCQDCGKSMVVRILERQLEGVNEMEWKCKKCGGRMFTLQRAQQGVNN